MPTSSKIISDKKYCDLLYAWLQCNSERISIDNPGRRIHKGLIKWVAIERDFTRVDIEGNEEKVMTRKTIANYFKFLEDQGYITLEEDGYYYLTVLDREMANLVEYNTLIKLMNVIQKDGINVYIYLLNRYIANGEQPFIATLNQIKERIGLATNTSSNNCKVGDILDILKRLGLLNYREYKQDNKTIREYIWVSNKLPD